MAGRPKKTSANPGRASIDLGGIAGAFGAGTDVGVEEVPAAEGSPSLTTLRAEKPSFFDNLMTKGAANQKYRDLDAQLKIQEMQQRFAAGQQTAADVAALKRIQEQARLQTEQEVGKETRTKSADQEAYTKMLPTLTQLLQKQGMMDVVLPEDVGAAKMMLGDLMKQMGAGSAYSGMVTGIGKDALTNIENLGRRTYAATPTGQTDIMSGYGATMRAPQTAQDMAGANLQLAAQQQASSDLSRLASQQAAQDDLALRRAALDFNQSQPIVQNGLAFLPKAGMQYDMYGVNPPQDSSTIIQDGRIVNIPATRTSVSPLNVGGKKPVAPVDPSLLQGVTPAPQPAAPISQPLSATPQQRTITPDEYFRRLNATPEYPNMTPTMQEIAASNRTPQDKQSLLMPMAQQQQAQYQRELEARRRAQQGLRPTLGQVLGF